MPDVFTKEKRSWVMSRIRGRDTKPEQRVALLVRKAGFRLKRFVKSLPGTPDVVIPSQRIAIFVNGCFWHGHLNCARATIPAGNRTFWRRKIDSNRRRDLRQIRRLRRQGWSVAVFWTCRKLTPFLVSSRIRRITRVR